MCSIAQDVLNQQLPEVMGIKPNYIVNWQHTHEFRFQRTAFINGTREIWDIFYCIHCLQYVKVEQPLVSEIPERKA